MTEKPTNSDLTENQARGALVAAVLPRPSLLALEPWPPGPASNEPEEERKTKPMPVYELINPSDPYTFEAPSIEVAGAAVALLSPSFGATRVGDDVEESTPVLFGWDEWLEAHGIDDAWWADPANLQAVAESLDSFLIGNYDRRQDVLDMLAELPEEKREAWRARRQDRHRSRLNQIGEAAYDYAKQLREKVAESEIVQ